MKTLGDAWAWYESARLNLHRMRRLGARHWDDASLEHASLWRDDQFKEVEASHIARETALALEPLDDLGVLVMFSVFEAVVRDQLERDVRASAAGLGHPVLRHAAEEALDGIRQGSFANNVLGPLKVQGQVPAELAEQVRQVREYRNWVGHGRGAARPATVTPLDAYDRLREFLDALGIPTGTPGSDPA